jgi:peptidoglycan/LPS O-acetylase OafA/YrhL
MFRRNAYLDVLRFVAIALVLLHHMTPEPPRYPHGIGWLLVRITHAGWCGVDLFFVLSGFLVSGLLFREYRERGRLSLKSFLIRRGLKIYPGFYFLLAVYGPLDIIATPKSGEVARVLHETFFIQNYTSSLFSQTWSLAVEEHFYLAIALLMALLASRRAIHWVPRVCLLVLPLSLFLRFREFVPHERSTYYPTHLRMDSLAFGVILSYLFHFYPAVFDWIGRHRKLIFVASLLAVFPIFCVNLDDSKYIQTVGFSVNYVAFGGLVAIAATPASSVATQSVLVNRLAELGSYSYSTYLWHMAVKRILTLIRRSVVPLPYALEFVLFVVLTFVVGVAMAKLVEFPVLRLRDRYWPRAGTGPAAGTTRGDLPGGNAVGASSPT